MAKEWDVLTTLETLIDTISTFESVTIGFESDLFHSKKWAGQLPAVFLEYRGDEEEGPLDSSFERYVPFTVTVVIVDKASSVKKNRRDKINTAITYKNLIKDKLDDNPQLSAQQVNLSPVGACRVPETNERVPSPYWAVEIDLPMAIWETQSGR